MSKKHNAFTERKVQRGNIVRNHCCYQNVHAYSTSFKPQFTLSYLVQNKDSCSLHCIYFYICRQFVKSNVRHCQGYRLYTNKCNENPYFGRCMQTSREKTTQESKTGSTSLSHWQTKVWLSTKIIFDVETLLAAELANRSRKLAKNVFLHFPHLLHITNKFTFFHFLLAFSIIYFWFH